MSRRESAKEFSITLTNCKWRRNNRDVNRWLRYFYEKSIQDNRFVALAVYAVDSPTVKRRETKRCDGDFSTHMVTIESIAVD